MKKTNNQGTGKLIIGSMIATAIIIVLAVLKQYVFNGNGIIQIGIWLLSLVSFILVAIAYGQAKKADNSQIMLILIGPILFTISILVMMFTPSILGVSFPQAATAADVIAFENSPTVKLSNTIIFAVQVIINLGYLYVVSNIKKKIEN